MFCIVCFFSSREKGSDASWKNDQEPPPEVTIERVFFGFLFLVFLLLLFLIAQVICRKKTVQSK